MKWFFLILLLLIGFLYFLPDSAPSLSSPQEQKLHERSVKEPTVTTGMISLIGKSGKEVKTQFGQPTRIDDSAYDYKWWIYNKKASTYLQIGIMNGRVVTAFICGEQVNVKPFRIGQTLQEVLKIIPVSSSVEVSLRTGTYRFELSEQDMAFQPIVKINGVYAQLYIDHFTGKISSIRLMDGATLVKLRPYELVYRGALPSAKPLSPEEQRRVEIANTRQIFDITNVIRERYNVKPLRWHEEAAQVAYEHSKDMKENGYFSHESPTQGDLKDRLLSAGIKFQMAGENIAAQYVDGIAAVEGWLNSKSHREALLNPQFTHLGLGVADKYYTQDFLKPW